MYRRDAKFFFTRQNPSNINDEYINERGTNNFKNENEFSDETKKQQTEELIEKQLRDQQEEQLKELQEKQLRDQQEEQIKEQKRIKKESNLLFN